MDEDETLRWLQDEYDAISTKEFWARVSGETGSRPAPATCARHGPGEETTCVFHQVDQPAQDDPSGTARPDHLLAYEDVFVLHQRRKSRPGPA